jgi:dUTP pyrophosphatase
MQIKIERESADVKVPTYGTAGAACFDIAAYMPGEDRRFIAPGGAEFFKTGLKFEVPEGYVMLAFSRSGHGFKDGIRLVNCVGVIDSDYRGELGVKLHNDSKKMFSVADGDRVAQAMILPVAQVTFVEGEELTATVRGENGYGSTGVQ